MDDSTRDPIVHDLARSTSEAMKRRTIVVVAASLMAALVVALWSVLSTPTGGFTPTGEIESTFADSVGGNEGIETLKNPTRVEAHRIKHRGDDYSDYKNYEVISEAVPVSNELATVLVRDLFTLKSFVGEPKKACMPNYGIRLSSLREDDRVEIYLCFDCALLLVVRNSSVVGGKDFGRIEENLLRVVKTLFPNDHEIQDLKTQWERAKARRRWLW